ncbi:hypothetical protein [Halodesulfovibrio marinisediminis]|uniref:Uncharacterized protein n=1 Tax=Halodesulfovibrio marinisediminis DSM 17456 TaxID=1121457 RepID=A0A1N6ID23_9BACT|nr:hypothetical protein [Halodesulfovibrio marinisediminis]SIO29879.1 hypothetical protein SAMN02745161_2633 [Halodesulfovibrio marinisediminis DSM 17456]
MTDFDSLSSALKDEVMTDIATGFFGARKAIDDERDLFHHVESDLRLAEQRALNTCAQLKALLTSERDLEKLLRLLGVSVEFLERMEDTDPWINMELPFAFTAEGRYKKCVLKTYENMYSAFKSFLHGITYKTTDTFRKFGQTTGYYRYVEWCDDLNERIKKVNRDRSPAHVLSVVRDLDVDTVAKQRAVGAVNVAAGCLPGDDLCLLLVPCEDLKAMELPEIPPLNTQLSDKHTVESILKEYASEIYKRDREKVKQILSTLKKD